jgi:hypothetical protein
MKLDKNIKTIFLILCLTLLLTNDFILCTLKEKLKDKKKQVVIAGRSGHTVASPLVEADEVSSHTIINVPVGTKMGGVPQGPIIRQGEWTLPTQSRILQPQTIMQGPAGIIPNRITYSPQPVERRLIPEELVIPSPHQTIATTFPNGNTKILYTPEYLGINTNIPQQQPQQINTLQGAEIPLYQNPTIKDESYLRLGNTDKSIDYNANALPLNNINSPQQEESVINNIINSLSQNPEKLAEKLEEKLNSKDKKFLVNKIKNLLHNNKIC